MEVLRVSAWHQHPHLQTDELRLPEEQRERGGGGRLLRPLPLQALQGGGRQMATYGAALEGF